MSLRKLKSYSVHLIFSLILFKPEYFGTISAISSIYEFLTIVLALVILFRTVRDRTLSYDLLTIFLYYFTIILSTLLANKSIVPALNFSGKAIVCILYINHSIKTKSLNDMLTVWSKIFIAYLTINLLTMYLYPDGLYWTSFVTQRSYFLGHRNYCAFYSVIFLSIEVLHCVLKKISISKDVIILGVLSLWTTVYAWSATTLVTLAVFVLLLLLKNIEVVKKVVNIRLLLIGSLAITAGLLFFNLAAMFSYPIEVFLKKNVTLTGRMDIWVYFIGRIKDSFLLGYGHEETDIIEKLATIYTHSHNNWINIIYESGITGIFIFIAAILQMTRKLTKNRNNIWYSYVLSACTSIFLIHSITEFESTQRMMFFYTFLLVAYNNAFVSDEFINHNYNKSIITNSRRTFIDEYIRPRWLSWNH